ncbi:MAG TPA: PhnA protein [Gammaproteobacteria bacterium]|nr:PhnA protein [Gammaproteobacteria bacterium]
MTTEEILQQRSNNSCELCASDKDLAVYPVPPESEQGENDSIYLCETCRSQIENPDSINLEHWRCLNNSMWSTVPAVQVVAWRMLKQLSRHPDSPGWPQDLLDMLYLDDELLAWAKAGLAENTDSEEIKHLDSNGAQLSAGDTVTLIKDLNVKGANFTAKRGTAVRGISLVADNPEQIEGRVNGQQIVILTKFVKKSG